MRVLIAGGSGVLGRSLVVQLRRAGHEVTCLGRSPVRLLAARDLGAQVVACDALDQLELTQAVQKARPEVIVNKLTAIPATLSPRRRSEQFAATDRLRTLGGRNLVAAGRAAGARRLVAQSVAFMYQPVGGWIKAEEAPLWLDAPSEMRRSVAAIAELEETVLTARDLKPVVLRYGYLYGPGTMLAADGSMAAAVRRGRLPIVGKGDGHWSFIHIEDAAAATVSAMGERAGGVYNVVDDEPAAVRDWLPVLADALGARRPSSMPAMLVRWLAGPYAVSVMTEQRGASNDKICAELEWEPQWKSWREGFLTGLDQCLLQSQHG
ncbi:MAG: NAD(P)-dependent oxidoreductase [Candidatus Dormibacteraeota bacterium]|uniref:NAD(P)-dependent oxidoreductase n=2 Tax=Candidatus Dormiibacter inghamiae TaxID=3127013 RepID=A0A934KHT8_9BACT|nr:NAD(P)-dependent oxidoreductase [Candidatus Dormibacteraeota bacterium]